jgi:hypothetical protein
MGCLQVAARVFFDAYGSAMLFIAPSSAGKWPSMKRAGALLITGAMLLALVPAQGPAIAAYRVRAQSSVPLADHVMDYPRIASIYSLRLPDQAQALARYGLVIAPEAAATSGALLAAKQADPNTRIMLYDNTSAVAASGFDGLTIYPGWWLTLAGTRLSGAIDAATTSIPVVNASVIQRFLATNPDVLVDGETMHVLSVDTVRNRLTVQRGLNSTAAPHGAGARLAAHATKWPGTWMLNVTPYCPVDPVTHQTWVQYAAQQAAQALRQAPWDGILWDDANTNFTRLSKGQLDADNDNRADGGNGPSPDGWQQGVQRLLSLTRSLAPGAVQLVTDAVYPGMMDGQLMEHFPYYADGWSKAFNSYLEMAGPGGFAPASIISADAPSAQHLRTMRFDLGTTLMGDGYFAYDRGPQNHGQTWWYDEYDDGAGSSLRATIDASQTTLMLAPGTTSRFSAGDVIHVPDGATVYDDEQMLITGISGDTLSVQRGYNGSTATAHGAGTKVFTLEQLAGGLGWLGQPLAPAKPMALSSPSLLANGNFTGAVSAGTFTVAASAGNSPGAVASWLSPWQFTVQSPALATVQRDGDASTGISARIQVQRAAPPDEGWFVTMQQPIVQQERSARLVAGTPYTLSFWARSSAHQTIRAMVQQAVSPWSVRAYQDYRLTADWQRYSLTFTATTTEAAAKVAFVLAQDPGTIWLRGVSFQQGDSNLWRRDFTHGTVLLNATNRAQTVTLGPGYRHIAGTQDPSVNTGAPATTITIAPQDAILLVRTS